MRSVSIEKSIMLCLITASVYSYILILSLFAYYAECDNIFILSVLQLFKQTKERKLEMSNEASVEIITQGKTVTAYLSGEIDHHNAVQLRNKIDTAINNRRPEVLNLDFSEVSFMDSSGIGLVMGRYRLIENTACNFYVTNLSAHAYKVMQLAGLEKIATLKKRQGELK